ncbi:MAG: CocE/NonD family hydrolase [Ruminococcaceae bacterium]|nr:CocE/NonD family hydrolase [Oscillospiraceae bacterium]
MLDYRTSYTYIESEGNQLFTVVMLPGEGKYPTILSRSPYVDSTENMPEEQIALQYLGDNRAWLAAGYALIIQHCRGRGKSSGDCIPYIHEREDGLALQAWVRRQPFYNGEIFLKGGSYLTTVHYATAPFADDIKGAIFGVQDTERYNIAYRNGCFKKGLHGSWYVGMYKKKSKLRKFYTERAFDMLPFSDFSRTVLGEPAEDFDELIRHPDPSDDFWNTRFGGADTRGATDNVKFPMLLTTGFYDIYTGGIFDMWRQMSPETREHAALVVSPYDHGDNGGNSNPIVFPAGKRKEGFGEDYEIRWFDAIRGKGAYPFQPGKITYYRLFENRWATDDFMPHSQERTLTIGGGKVDYVYNPYDAPGFNGGLSAAFGGTQIQEKPGLREDIITVYTKPFEQDTFVKGKIAAKLKVASDCEDTCFYIRLSLETIKGDYGLRDDITTLCRQHPDYVPGQAVELTFSCDDHAFLVRRGERLRIDIASADREHYVRHTNNKGLFSEQTTAKIARNTVWLDESTITLPVE